MLLETDLHKCILLKRVQGPTLKRVTVQLRQGERSWTQFCKGGAAREHVSFPIYRFTIYSSFFQESCPPTHIYVYMHIYIYIYIYIYIHTAFIELYWTVTEPWLIRHWTVGFYQLIRRSVFLKRTKYTLFFFLTNRSTDQLVKTNGSVAVQSRFSHSSVQLNEHARWFMLTGCVFYISNRS